MTNFICSYFDKKDDYINAIYDEDIETLMIINTDTKETKIFFNMHNARQALLEFMADSFDIFQDVNTSIFELDSDDLESLKDCECYERFIEECKYWEVKMEE